jgi:hypothetical protein
LARLEHCKQLASKGEAHQSTAEKRDYAKLKASLANISKQALV